MAAISRTPPVQVRRILKREVNFGCAVEGCGSPFLSWHHFDPRWSERHHNEPEGMIALCLQHHKEADAGAFTKDQLRKMKKHPFLQEVKVKGKFNWRRHSMLMEVGGNYHVRPRHILRVRGHNIVSVVGDEAGLQAVSLDIRDASEQVVFKMDANDWIIEGDLDDIECPPSANRLMFKSVSRGVSLQLNFRSVGRNQLQRRVLSKCKTVREALLRSRPARGFVDWDNIEGQIWAQLDSSIQQWPATICTVGGQLQWPIPIALCSTATVLPGDIILSINVTVDSDTAINVN